MSNPLVTLARRADVLCLLLLVGMLVSPLSQATPRTQYGPPYTADSTSGSQSFPTVNEAVQFVIDGAMRLCQSNGCEKPPVFTVSYSDGFAAASVYSNGHWWGDVYANDKISGEGQPVKNTGSCNTMCTGGLGQAGDSTGPHGSSGNAALKQGGVHRGTAFEGDPINSRL
ncbi:hypothetical protein RMA73_00730 [Xanthomonas translucens pv. translucens]|uniref:hypothetical protein n=2 Tax=Xanthomonas campestris pv. translucens TaxID=343 RepID=UPI000AB727C4|nr:hypothetical protein [Xanthomonas translucens]QSQ39481.1 hypothetical protein ISN32_08840 [Xanthomonas translucens pv. translucens]UII62118.1 hypothetical protein LZE81_09320 [Xanthomonas translucens]UII62617.1 hypothetical protein LV507_11495 [Xanthomonas translucens]UKE59795.1 hypothetical protein KFS86_09290 [Xanthomonas translucens pv. hordei]UNU12591.1 hypothetical protein KBV71_07785 [Xanthomonas translucens pv. translucens]